MNKSVYKYYRLSLNDKNENIPESNSITNQRQIVESHLANIVDLANIPSIEAVDDGYTGTNFNRPGIKKIIDAAQRGEVACIIVKDLSRFGRDYLEVSKYIDQLFPYLGIRFIAIGDGYDSNTHKGTTPNVDVPIRNILNALYSKNVSKTVKLAKSAQAQQGKYINAFAPFGYKKDPVNKHRIIIDKPAAETVKRIFELFCDGKTKRQIANLLNAENAPTPSDYKKKNGSKLSNNSITGDIWTYHTVNKLLRNEHYVGTYVSGKKNSGKLGTNTHIHKPENEWIKVKNNHPSIISQKTWNMAVSIHGKQKRNASKPNISRILYKRVRCGYCGHVMQKTTDAKQRAYTCRTAQYTNEYGCTREKFSEEKILDVVKIVVQSNIKLTNKKSTKEKNITPVKTANDITNEIEQLQITKRRLYEKYKKNDFGKDVYFKEREIVENIIKEKVAALDNITDETLNETQCSFDSFTNFANTLVDAVHIYSDERFEVNFSFTNLVLT